MARIATASASKYSALTEYEGDIALSMLTAGQVMTDCLRREGQPDCKVYSERPWAAAMLEDSTIDARRMRWASPAFMLPASGSSSRWSSDCCL